MSLTNDDVRHIAKLARLTLDEADVPRFGKELSSILDYISVLQEVDTDSVEPLAQVTGLQSVSRDDTVLECPTDGADLLACSPLGVTERQIQVPSAHG